MKRTENLDPVDCFGKLLALCKQGLRALSQMRSHITQGHYSWSQGMGILGDKVQKSQEFVTFLPTSLLFICKRGNASLHSAQ